VPTSPTRVYRVWAITSSLGCVALLAYIVASHVTAPAPAAPAPPAAPGDGTLEVPRALQGLPQEWMRASGEGDPTGYVALLDPDSARLLVVERCRHRGYFDLERGEPRDTRWSFCETVVEGSIASIEDDALVVQGDGERITRIGYAVEGTADAPRLLLSLGDTSIPLDPGSKNDLYQLLDRLPAIRAEHDAMLGTRDSRRPDGGDRDPSRD
jgi:hypothetical protein